MQLRKQEWQQRRAARGPRSPSPPRQQPASTLPRSAQATAPNPPAVARDAGQGIVRIEQQAPDAQAAQPAGAAALQQLADAALGGPPQVVQRQVLQPAVQGAVLGERQVL